MAVNLKKVKNDSVVQQIIDSLVEAMVKKELKPGDKIPTETELAESLGVGRNSVREAIKILTYLGVLKIKRAEGTFVTEGFSESMIDPMVYGIILDGSDSYDDLMELREITEVGVMQLAMRHSDQAELHELADILKEMKAELDREDTRLDALFDIDNRFHDKIADMGHNSLVTKINKVVRTLTYAMRYETVKEILSRDDKEGFYQAHANLLRILQDKNTENLNTSVRNTYFMDDAREAEKKKAGAESTETAGPQA